MPFSAAEFEFGPVLVIKGNHKNRIGYLDDETSHGGRRCGVVKFAPPLVTVSHYLVPLSYLEYPNTQQLLTRYSELWRQLFPDNKDRGDLEHRVRALEEYALVSDTLNERMFDAQFTRNTQGAKLFISHSSADKQFVRGLAVDLANRGHQPWLDEWEILAGESITERVAQGVEDSDFLLLVLSDAAVRSRWVEQEWHAKHWAEINERQIKVIPLLKEMCEVPTLLRSKKYIDLRPGNYADGLDLLCKSINLLVERRS